VGLRIQYKQATYIDIVIGRQGRSGIKAGVRLFFYEGQLSEAILLRKVVDNQKGIRSILLV
jgi:hypothetical protein